MPAPIKDIVLLFLTESLLKILNFLNLNLKGDKLLHLLECLLEKCRIILKLFFLYLINSLLKYFFLYFIFNFNSAKYLKPSFSL